MATNEETGFVTGNNQAKEEKKVANQNGNGWQSITIGGVTGILMGAAAMYGAEALAKGTGAEKTGVEAIEGDNPVNRSEEVSSHVADNGLKVAEVDQNLSFGEAFEAARNAVGSGGVFHWHGNIYNTYHLDEWNSMSADERQQFAQQVKPEIRPGEGHTGHKDDIAHVGTKTDPDSDEPTPHKPDNKEEVHFLGFANVEYEGQEYEAGHMSVRKDGEERHVYYIDVDNDPEQEFDVIVSDTNNDGKLTKEESTDISERHLNKAEFALATAIMDESNNNPTESGQVAAITQDEIAPDMPDYMNDANTII